MLFELCKLAATSHVLKKHTRGPAAGEVLLVFTSVSPTQLIPVLSDASCCQQAGHPKWHH